MWDLIATKRICDIYVLKAFLRIAILPGHLRSQLPLGYTFSETVKYFLSLSTKILLHHFSMRLNITYFPTEYFILFYKKILKINSLNKWHKSQIVLPFVLTFKSSPHFSWPGGELALINGRLLNAKLCISS